VRLAEVEVDSGWVGERVSMLEKTANARVAFVTRFGEGLLPVEDTVIQDGDIVHVVMRDADAEAVEQVFRSRPSEES
jgi:trk system potassium uptake protein TrkA